VVTDSGSYSGTQKGFISGKVVGVASGSQIQLSITNPLGNVIFTGTVAVQVNGTFSDTFQTGGGSAWVAGTYAVTATYGTTSPINTSSTFYYTSTTLTTTATTTVVSTVVSPTTVTSTTSLTGQVTTVTQPTTTTVTQSGTNTVTQTSTHTQTQTQTETQTLTQTSTVTNSSGGVPGWAYGVMVVLLIVGLAVGYVVAGSMSRRPAVK
jgi:hypothetical protein